MSNTYVRGSHNIGNFPAGTGLDVVDDRIIRLMGIKAPTMGMMQTDAELPMEETNDLFRWRTEDEQPNYVTVNGAILVGGTTLTVDEIDLIQEGQYLLTPDDEMIQATSLNSTANTATIARGMNGTTATAIADDAKLLIMPQALKPRETPGLTPTKYGEFRQNFFCQFGWQMGQDYWSSAKPSWMLEPTDQTRLEAAKQKFFREGPMARQMEIAIWYGTGQAMTENQAGYFNGIKAFNTVNLTTSAGDLTYNMVLDHVHTINQKKGLVAGQDVRRFRLYGNAYMLAIFNALASTYQSSYKEQSAQISPNLRVSQFETDFGILEFMVIDQLRNGELYGVDFSDISFKPMAVKLGPNAGLFIEFTQDHINLGTLEEIYWYYFRGSIKVGHPALHFGITGITMNTGAYTGYTGPTPV